MIEPISYGWKCPCCGRVYNPRQEMCLYCGPNEKTSTIDNLGDWISTNPSVVKESGNIHETNGTPGSPFYTTTTGSIGYEGPVQEIVLDAQRPEMTPCSSYVNGVCIGVKEPFEPDCQGSLSRCSEYNTEKR